MADEKKPAPTRGVPVDLDRTRHLRYPLGVLHGIEEFGLKDLPKMLYLGLKHEDEEITEEALGEMVDLEMLPDLAEPLRKATAGLFDITVLFNRNGSAPEVEAGETPEGKAPES